MPKLIKEYLERAEAETGEHTNYFHSDGGGEYGSTALQDYFKSKGIHHEMTNAYTPQENGVSKRMNRTLVEMAHAMLCDAGLPNAYWGDAVLYATHILNRIPTHAIDGDLTPHEAFTGNKPSVTHLKVFGCTAHIHVPDEKRRKLDAKSVECTLLGFAENRKAYVCVHRPSSHVFESRDVVFEEGNASAPNRMKIDDPGLNIEEIKRSAAGMTPEAKETSPYSPGEDGKTTKGDEASDEDPVDQASWQSINDTESALTHASNQPDHARSPAEVENTRQTANVQVPVERQVSRGQRGGKRLEHTSDGHPGHLLGPLSPYPVPIPSPAIRRSSCARKVLIHDDNSRFFVNAYERTTLEEEIQLNEEGRNNLPAHIEGLDNKGETDTRADVTESRCDTLTQSAWCAATATLLDIEPLTYNDTVSCPDADL